MGHSVDQLFYNKIWQLDRDYDLDQYQIAEKHLNVVSGISYGNQTLNEDQLLKIMLERPENYSKFREAVLNIEQIRTLINEAMKEKAQQITVDSEK